LPLVLLMVLLLLGDGERDGDLDGDGSLDLLLLAGLLFSTLVKLVSVGDLSLLLPLLPGLSSAESFLDPGCGRGLLESVSCLEEDEGPGPVHGLRLWAFFFRKSFL
jgi:hypothetical protein